MKKLNELTLIALTSIAFSASGCSLLPYESDYSCDYSEGYGKCLGARDNYELSQMSEQERSQTLNKNKPAKTTQSEANTNSLNCEALREQCNGDLDELAKLGCLTPIEQTAVKNNEALIYIERLLLDREAIKNRTPSDKDLIKHSDGLIVSDDKEGKVVIADARLNYANAAAESESGATNANANTIGVVCGFPQVSKGATIRIEVNRAWLRSEPNPDYPPINAIEAKRGDRFIVSQGWQTDACGWLRLSNGRYVHQSIISVIGVADRKAEND
jgi:hypothetical protein